MNRTLADVIRVYTTSDVFRLLAPATQRNYIAGLKAAEEGIGSFSIEIVRPSVVQAFLDGFAHLPGKQVGIRTSLKALEAYAVVRDLLPYPICTGTVVVGSDGGHEPWTDAQVALAESKARPELARAITLAVNTGQRGSDVVRLGWSDIEVQGNRPGLNVIQRKTGVRLWVPMTQALISAVQDWGLKRAGPFVLMKTGKPFTRAKLSWHWHHERDNNPELSPLKEAGCVLHGLRATAVVRFRKLGLSTLQISDLVGLSEPMVSRYSRLADKTERALAAVHFLDRTSGEHQNPISKVFGKIVE